MKNIINLTPHSITFVDANGNQIRIIEASGQLARVSSATETVGEIDGIPITETVFGEVEGLPAPKADTIYVVSSLVAQRCTDRSDVFIPSESVRDDAGRIIGCRSLGRVEPLVKKEIGFADDDAAWVAMMHS